MSTTVTTAFVVAKAVLITSVVSILKNYYNSGKFSVSRFLERRFLELIKDKEILTRTSKTKIISYYYCGTCPLDI